jgi:hypothetical protein
MLKVNAAPPPRSEEDQGMAQAFPAPSPAESPTVEGTLDVESDRPTLPPPEDTPARAALSGQSDVDQEMNEPRPSQPAAMHANAAPVAEHAPPGTAGSAGFSSRVSGPASLRAMLGVSAVLFVLTALLLAVITWKLGRIEQAIADGNATAGALTKSVAAVAQDVSVLKTELRGVRAAMPDPGMRHEIMRTGQSVTAIEKQVMAWAEAEAQAQAAEDAKTGATR